MEEPMGGLSKGPISDPTSIYPQLEGSQIGDTRLSTSCGIVEQPEHRCGDDLVKQESAPIGAAARNSATLIPERHIA